ncbi:MAG: ABC transporter ATP-binding protein, partial [Sulfobacillus sp.]|nr:ABC transporter ATP-binding protein [Sulfobacillus sp.]
MLFTALALYAGGAKVLRGNMTPGELVVLISYLRALITPSRTLAKMTGQVSIAMASLDRVRELLDAPLPTHAPGQVFLVEAPLGIQIRNVQFTYPNQREPVLTDVNLDLPPGRRVAILGQSGIGKSTLI